MGLLLVASLAGCRFATPAGDGLQAAGAAISWTLTTAAALAFAVGAWQFQGLAAEVRALRSEITAINVRTSVIEAARYGDAIKDLDGRVRALERDRSTR